MSHPAASAADRTSDRADLEARIRALGPWFHNLTIRGVQTAPDHFLGDYPSLKWRQFAHAIPADLTGRTVLDIGCNAGFYSLEMKRRGAARVVGIDWDLSRQLIRAAFPLLNRTAQLGRARPFGSAVRGRRFGAGQGM